MICVIKYNGLPNGAIPILERKYDYTVVIWDPTSKSFRRYRNYGNYYRFFNCIDASSILNVLNYLLISKSITCTDRYDLRYLRDWLKENKPVLRYEKKYEALLECLNTMIYA